MQVGRYLRRMQPAFVVWDHSGGANQPDARFVLFDKYLTARVLLAQRNLAVGANDLDDRRR